MTTVVSLMTARMETIVACAVEVGALVGFVQNGGGDVLDGSSLSLSLSLSLLLLRLLLLLSLLYGTFEQSALQTPASELLNVLHKHRRSATMLLGMRWCTLNLNDICTMIDHTSRNKRVLP